MKEKPDVLQGTLALMVLKTLDALGPQHGYGIARRIEQISGDVLAVNQGALYPLLLKLENEGSIASPIPEPSISALLGAGIIAFFGFRWWRGRLGVGKCITIMPVRR